MIVILVQSIDQEHQFGVLPLIVRLIVHFIICPGLAGLGHALRSSVLALAFAAQAPTTSVSFSSTSQ